MLYEDIEAAKEAWHNGGPPNAVMEAVPELILKAKQFDVALVKAKEALKWYAEMGAKCHLQDNLARFALTQDGGVRAQEALWTLP